jgi:hypothetical protein
MRGDANNARRGSCICNLANLLTLREVGLSVAAGLAENRDTTGCCLIAALLPVAADLAHLQLMSSLFAIHLQNSMAGEEGFEPSNAGIKIQCLNRLGDSPTQLGVCRGGE